MPYGKGGSHDAPDITPRPHCCIRRPETECMKRLFAKILTPLGTATFVALLILERRRPLRRARDNANVRLVRNVALSALTGIAIQIAFLPIMTVVAGVAERRRIGLLQRVPMPEPARSLLALLLLDYTYYWWHRLLHQIPLLWRFHIVHHADHDMDVSTALRFHYGEWLLSTPFRAVQTLAVGASQRDVATFELSMMLAVLFHHSNLRLPASLEHSISQAIVTPRMHGIHHSVARMENSSNFSTLSSLWDRLHRTRRDDVRQECIDIGLPGYETAAQMTVGTLLMLPFNSDTAIPYMDACPLLSFVPIPGERPAHSP